MTFTFKAVYPWCLPKSQDQRPPNAGKSGKVYALNAALPENKNLYITYRIGVFQ